MYFNEAKVQFTINPNFIDKSKNKYEYSEEELRKFIEDIAKGLQYCILIIYMFFCFYMFLSVLYIFYCINI